MSEAKVESFDLEKVGTLDPVEVFTGDYLDEQTALGRELLKSHKPDVSTKKGRDAVASFSKQFTTVKVRVEKAGLALGVDLRDQLSKIGAKRNVFKEDWQAMQDEARKPLTDWEAEDQKRVDDEKKAIEEELDRIEALRLKEEDDRRLALEKKEAEIAARELALEEAEEARLAAIEKEEAAQMQIERDAEFQRQANIKAAQDAQDAIDTANREKQEAIEQAEADRLQAIEDAKQKDIDDAIEKERVRVQAEEGKAAAIKRERDRGIAEMLEQEKAEKLREADKKHKAKINNEILIALVKGGLSKPQAKTAIEAIAKGQIPHTKISY